MSPAKKKSPSPKPGRGLALGDKVLKRSSDVFARRASDGRVSIIRLDNDRFIFTLDYIAAEFWMLINGRSTVDEIVKTLIAKHKPPLVRFEKDIAGLIRDLRKKRLINIS